MLRQTVSKLVKEGATTAGYVKRLGRRPESVARRAAELLDVQGDEDPSD